MRPRFLYGFRRHRCRPKRLRTAVRAGTVRVIGTDPIAVGGVRFQPCHSVGSAIYAINLAINLQIIAGRSCHRRPTHSDRFLIRRSYRISGRLRSCPYFFLWSILADTVCIFRPNPVRIFRIFPQSGKCSGRCYCTVSTSVKLNIVACCVTDSVPFHGNRIFCCLPQHIARNIRHFRQCFDCFSRTIAANAVQTPRSNLISISCLRLQPSICRGSGVLEPVYLIVVQTDQIPDRSCHLVPTDGYRIPGTRSRHGSGRFGRRSHRYLVCVGACHIRISGANLKSIASSGSQPRNFLGIGCRAVGFPIKQDIISDCAAHFIPTDGRRCLCRLLFNSHRYRRSDGRSLNGLRRAVRACLFCSPRPYRYRMACLWRKPGKSLGQCGYIVNLVVKQNVIAPGACNSAEIHNNPRRFRCNFNVLWNIQRFVVIEIVGDQNSFCISSNFDISTNLSNQNIILFTSRQICHGCI